MTTSLNGQRPEDDVTLPTPQLEAEVQTAIRGKQERSSFFAGCVIWFAAGLIIWAAAGWSFFH